MCYAYYALYFFFFVLLFRWVWKFFFIIIYRAHFRRGIVLCTLSVMMMLMVGKVKYYYLRARVKCSVEKCVYAKKCANLFNVYEGCKEWGKLALKHTATFFCSFFFLVGFMWRDRYGKWLLLRCFYTLRV